LITPHEAKKAPLELREKVRIPLQAGLLRIQT
jgi:hypothetical protein